MVHLRAAGTTSITWVSDARRPSKCRPVITVWSIWLLANHYIEFYKDRPMIRLLLNLVLTLYVTYQDIFCMSHLHTSLKWVKSDIRSIDPTSQPHSRMGHNYTSPSPQFSPSFSWLKIPRLLYSICVLHCHYVTTIGRACETYSRCRMGHPPCKDR